MTTTVPNPMLTTPCVDFQKNYTSLPITITANMVLPQAHGFGAIPRLVYATIRCAVAEHNYSIGDEVQMNIGTASGQGQLACDGTNITILTVGTPTALDKTAGTSFTITLANWKLILRAWA